MASRIDWLDYAFKLDKEREAIKDRLPAGVDCWLTLSAYGHSAANFSVHLNHAGIGLDGYGAGRTPAKALDAAMADLQKKADEQGKRPRLVGTKELPPRR